MGHVSFEPCLVFATCKVVGVCYRNDMDGGLVTPESQIAVGAPSFDGATSNFERLFTPRTWLRSASNFGKTRFRRFATFDFSTLKKLFDEFFGSEIRFSSFSMDFGGATSLVTSKSDSLTNFASGIQIFRSVRRLEVSFGRLLRSDTHHGTIARALNRNGYNWRQVAKKTLRRAL